ncbi:MAG: Unknown protein [uncultured Thiotrichaceae bacterium]|uniref:Uncharacterized protein n=1 Tax=uncultured Thiotrichaceae bacterium TaxID=298394 RepID=A0A6S6S8G6_9GAMM|nr:MAG: Unknown protein [uncultured Thiotrichaceae bacterium]
MTDKNANIVTAKQSRFAARVFNIGTIASVTVPFPLFIFWFGASMFVYALYRHHPNPRVGYYTQRGAYYYYGLSGLLIPILTFAPKTFFTDYWWALWGFCFLLVVPLAIIDIVKAGKEDWEDVEIPNTGINNDTITH